MVPARRRRQSRLLYASEPISARFSVPAWAKRMLMSFLIAAMFLGVLLPYLWVQAEINEATAERRAWRRMLEETIEEHQSLQFELSELKSASRIEQVATEKLGMARPTQVIYVEPTLH